MSALDWSILAIYIGLMIFMGYWIGRKQNSQVDYYVAGRHMPAWQIALSIMATQVSAISLIGAPAFVALRTGGGLKWLQYEFAIPIAMIAIMWVMVPIYHRLKIITIYTYLENRFGLYLRLVVSGVFLLARGLGSGVALLATGIVTAVCLNWPLPETILLIGVVALIYTTFGGIKADIYSDILQLFILWGAALVSIGIIWNFVGNTGLQFTPDNLTRLKIVEWRVTGLGDGHPFSFWAMLIGGFFLYVSYYGADQSQSQRLLATASRTEAAHALFLNGLLRFPLVITYLTFGVLLIPFLNTHPTFAASLKGLPADFLVPQFLIQFVPNGLLGIIIAGIFAASMSSLDSAMNSLSAATYHDVLIKIWPSLKKLPNSRQVLLSRLLTIIWGTVATLFALWVAEGEETVIELVNKIGSAFYGPILATFWLGMLTQRTRQGHALVGLMSGVLFNVLLWKFFSEQISWLWWNALGFGFTMVVAYTAARLFPVNSPLSSDLVLTRTDFKQIFIEEKSKILWLFIAFWAIIISSVVLERFLAQWRSMP